MKHKLLNKLLFLTLLTWGGVMINPAWADGTYSLTPDQSSTGSSASTYITTLTEFTYNGISWKMNQWNPKTLQVKTNQSSASSEFRFYNTSAFPGKIKQVVITFSALSISDASKLMFLGGSSEVTATTGGTAGTWNSSAKTLTWTPSASDNFTYFAFYQNGKAASGTNNLAGSDAIVVTYATPTCATPTFSPAAGTYYSAQDITISTETAGATIHYTTDGSTPTSSSTTFSSAITVSESMTIKAIAVKGGFVDSEVATADYTIDIKPTPSLSFPNASYDASLGSAFAAPTLTNTNSVSPITYSSSDTGVATVNESTGVVALVGAGTTTITASFDGDASYSPAEASYTLNVSDPAVATTVTISDAGITNTDVYVSTTAGSFAATVKDNEDATIGGATVTWSSSDESVATINASTGVVTLVAAGTTTITATYAGVPYTYQGSSTTYELTVTSSAPITDETITFSELYNANKTLTDIEINAKYFSVTFAKPSGTAPQYYTTGTAVRAYAGNTFTVSSDSKTIEKIELTFGESDGSNTISTDVGSYSAGTWTGLASSVTFTIGGSSGHRRISAIKVYYDNRIASDLTKTGDVTLDFKGGNTDANLTEYFTSSSTGAYTYTIADETVIANVGELISALKVGTTTVTVSQAADAKYKAGEITINVTVKDSRTACVTDLDLASAKTILKAAEGDLSVTATVNGEFNGTINYTYVSANEEIFLISGTEYLGAGVGATTVTVTATPTGGNAASYKPVSAVVDVTVNGTNSISLDKTSKEQLITDGAFSIAATVPTENYNGTVSAESSNTYVATVSVDGTTITVNPVAAGTATITVTAGTGTYYPTTVSTTCAVTVTAPEGSEEAPNGILFEEYFSKCEGSGGNKTGTFSNGTQNTTVSGKTDKSYSTITNAFYADGCARLGTSSANGVLTTTTISLTGNATLTFSGAGWNGSDTNTITVTATGATLSGDTNVTLTNAVWKNYSIDITGATGSVTITFTEKRGFLDDIVIRQSTETVTINKYGYATYCSVNPIDFTSPSGYTAWRVSNIAADGTITFAKITEKIKGGQGVLLYNKDADGENTSEATITFADGTTEFASSENLFVGTTAPFYLSEVGQVYGLSGNKFVKNSAVGNIGANKAYIPAASIPNEVKTFNFVFEDDADGINEVENGKLKVESSIYNLAGQRMNKMQKGINIVNGKKILK